MGLLDYYRQFQGLSEEEVNERLRAQAADRRERALARLEPLDLTQTTWPHLPHPYVVNAVNFVARRGLHRYLARGTDELREELAHRHGVGPERVAVGNGAAQLLGSAAQALLESDQELICPWPAYPLLPAMARRGRARAVPIDGFGVEELLAGVNERTRVVAISSPNDPTGELLGAGDLRRLLERLPDGVAVLLDEALVEYAGADAAAATLELLQEHPRLVLFRSFSKAWGLAGLRCGYALGGPGADPLLASIQPELGVNELAQAGALEALRSCSELIVARTALVAAERQRLAGELEQLGLRVAESRANFLWVAHPALDGGELAHRLAQASVLVASGGALGDPSRIRVSVQDRPASERLLSAMRGALEHSS